MSISPAMLDEELLIHGYSYTTEWICSNESLLQLALVSRSGSIVEKPTGGKDNASFVGTSQVQGLQDFEHTLKPWAVVRVATSLEATTHMLATIGKDSAGLVGMFKILALWALGHRLKPWATVHGPTSPEIATYML